MPAHSNFKFYFSELSGIFLSPTPQIFSLRGGWIWEYRLHRYRGPTVVELPKLTGCICLLQGTQYLVLFSCFIISSLLLVKLMLFWKEGKREPERKKKARASSMLNHNKIRVEIRAERWILKNNLTNTWIKVTRRKQ